MLLFRKLMFQALAPTTKVLHLWVLTIIDVPRLHHDWYRRRRHVLESVRDLFFHSMKFWSFFFLFFLVYSSVFTHMTSSHANIVTESKESAKIISRTIVTRTGFVWSINMTIYHRFGTPIWLP